ncbi:uncharacterized protein BX663DRAFT_544134 [Cokeromyces recurvatus]|uniref:uncharacterized protein n=1 Tax=Cokeromyces recurvatus TaxID=90255 RepID=UPI00221F39B4|nr:uncharacterized protein BX663DRAFT_544134 [Cokeromyces recurvatus]KAI7901363.1 hypothetical protein BX663DRAFT_544134 [Cokeromyces recurvatus]
MNVIIAPCPKKPSSTKRKDYETLLKENIDFEDINEAYQELQQILEYQQTKANNYDNFIITRTENPLIQDSSFIPSIQTFSQPNVMKRIRSYSVDDSHAVLYEVQTKLNIRTIRNAYLSIELVLPHNSNKLMSLSSYKNINNDKSSLLPRSIISVKGCTMFI